ncbi:MAG TPA: (Fe-S)-binding protein [Anaerolineae bacterium]|nr:(Fe-S)-binding protein [Anaerolineae bacterium]
MLIETYDLEVFTPPCDPGSERFSAFARLTADIREVLPYLNATLRGAVYNVGAAALTWKKGGHHVAFHADRIAVSNVPDREAAIQELEGLIELVNRTWERRAEVEPSHEVHRRPGLMEVYKLLPRSNCKACGEASCFVFANKLVAGQVRLPDCPVLNEPRCAEQQATLAGMLGVEMPDSGGRGL